MMKSSIQQLWQIIGLVECILTALLSAGAVPGKAVAAGESGTSTIKVSAPELLVSAPDDVTAAMGGEIAYSRSRGTEMILFNTYERVSDVQDEGYYRWSQDNGKTWSEAVRLHDKPNAPVKKQIVLPSGPLAAVYLGRHVGGWNEAFGQERVIFELRRVKPSEMDADVPEVYWTQTTMAYAVSKDDGRTLGECHPLIKSGSEFNEQHPFDGLYLGKKQYVNLYEPLLLDHGTMLVPAELSVLDEDGKLYTPHHRKHEVAQVVVLIGKRKGAGFEWDSSEPIRVDAFQESAMGLGEPTLAQLADGRIMMVMRGGNWPISSLPSYKWISLSSDRGRSWLHPKPWTYDTGSPIFSPSSVSQLVKHSSGRLFWFGNILPSPKVNRSGQGPRYPLVIGEVDLKTGLLKKSTVTIAADRSPSQSAEIQFSNFSTYEDRITHELVLVVTHYYPSGKRNRRNTGPAYTGNIYRYRISL